MRAPKFWQAGRGGLASAALLPVAGVYALAGRLRAVFTASRKIPVPVLCIGNLVAGGAGKTPVAIDIAERLRARGIAVHFLSRGYGGAHLGCVRVDPARHGARDVGDEPLLLARHAPTWVSPDRVRGARRAVEAGAELIVMDDGFQNPSLYKDAALVVIDGGFGFGNGRVIPAGPLREPIEDGMARARAAVLIGVDTTGSERVLDALDGAPPVLRARIAPSPGGEDLRGKAVFAFAGIARPAKFYATVRDVGAILQGGRDFPDHHVYGENDLEALSRAARAKSAILVTTAKDAVRLPRHWRDRVRVLDIHLIWEAPAALERFLDDVLDEMRCAR
ncbi:tetraacyldisaccharide 4'-kinase [Varunaivibrio sulfuroxidans]|uniref:tetraacyldisaccharide 4'-kinase n=1 Tax=Varunaivibrio sulfuroxidans TaxID=1773489 RepID=UPI00104B91E7|nr:tetraacyldisaccharide 4'-kinase [Varunaivibrio sulfuroxidans]